VRVAYVDSTAVDASRGGARHDVGLAPLAVEVVDPVGAVNETHDSTSTPDADRAATYRSELDRARHTASSLVMPSRRPHFGAGSPSVRPSFTRHESTGAGAVVS
jgi:hypothetical protein